MKEGRTDLVRQLLEKVSDEADQQRILSVLRSQKN